MRPWSLLPGSSEDFTYVPVGVGVEFLEDEGEGEVDGAGCDEDASSVSGGNVVGSVALVVGGGPGLFGGGCDSRGGIGVLLARGCEVDVPPFASEQVSNAVKFVVFRASLLIASDMRSNLH